MSIGLQKLYNLGPHPFLNGKTYQHYPQWSLVLASYLG